VAAVAAVIMEVAPTWAASEVLVLETTRTPPVNPALKVLAVSPLSMAPMVQSLLSESD
jgi:hypothetical protein